jgi:hypothetical protein
MAVGILWRWWLLGYAAWRGVALCGWAELLKVPSFSEPGLTLQDAMTGVTITCIATAVQCSLMGIAHVLLT